MSKTKPHDDAPPLPTDDEVDADAPPTDDAPPVYDLGEGSEPDPKQK